MSGNTRHVINMANSIVGVSILSMPYCFKEAGLILATVLVLFSGLLTKKTCMYLIRSAMMARRRSYELLAFQVFGVAGKLLMELCLICFLVGICISFHVVMGDLAPSIVANYMHIENSPSLRCTILSGIVLLVILPLCLLRNIDSLASMSACSIGFYVFLNSIIFYAALPRLLDGSWLSLVKLWEIKKAFHVLPIMSLALSCQSNVFEIYDSLPDPDVVKMKWVVGQAVNLCCALYIGVGFLGYIAFADVGIGGNVIMSFPSSGLTDGIKMLFVISLAISFPLMLFPCRTSIHSLICGSVSQVSYTDLVGNYMPEARFRVITVVVLIFSLILGILLPNIEFVLGLLGSTMGVLIAIILPSIFFIKVYTKSSADRILAQALLLFGLLIMVTGTFIHLHSIGNSNDVAMVKIPTKEIKDNEAKIIPIVQGKGKNPAVNGENLVGRKEPAIPEPPNILMPNVKEEIKKVEGSVLKPDLVPEKKADPETVPKPVSPSVVGKAPEVEELHPDAIKHEEKEKAVEGKEKEVIEQKQEQILSYIEEQQKKQNEMLEILHELKDKTDQKVSVKPAAPADLKVPAKSVNAPSVPKVGNASKAPIELPNQAAKENRIPAKIIPPQIKPNPEHANLLPKVPAAEIKSNISSIGSLRPPKSKVVKSKQQPVGIPGREPNTNKSNKHDEERKKRDLRQLEKESVPRMERHIMAVPNNINGEPVAGFVGRDYPGPLLLRGDIDSRRLLWTDLKIRRRRKQHDGDDYWDEI